MEYSEKDLYRLIREAQNSGDYSGAVYYQTELAELQSKNKVKEPHAD